MASLVHVDLVGRGQHRLPLQGQMGSRSNGVKVKWGQGYCGSRSKLDMEKVKVILVEVVIFISFYSFWLEYYVIFAFKVL